jgi:2-hydroxychromene-2-carboxylate isomerase
MKSAVEFYFDFSSPYGYLASTRIEAMAEKHGRKVSWHPLLLGPAFKAMGMPIMVTIPLKGSYSLRDFPRSARFHGVPYNQPSPFPVSTLAAARLFYWLKEKDERRAVSLARALFKAYFVDGINIGEADNVVKVAQAAGLDAGEVRAAIADQRVKDMTKAEVDASLAKGVFGSPYIIIDGEPFWGMDRLDQVERWLERPF